MTDGTTREIVDAWFANSTMNTKPVVPVDISAAAAALPQIGGAGTLRDLRSAMTLDQELQTGHDWYVGLQITIPFFEGFSRMYQVRQAQARLEHQQDALDDARQQVSLEVWSSYQAVQTSTNEVY